MADVKSVSISLEHPVLLILDPYIPYDFMHFKCNIQIIHACSFFQVLADDDAGGFGGQHQSEHAEDVQGAQAAQARLRSAK